MERYISIPLKLYIVAYDMTCLRWFGVVEWEKVNELKRLVEELKAELENLNKEIEAKEAELAELKQRRREIMEALGIKTSTIRSDYISPKEKQILEMLKSGMTPEEVRQQLNLKETTMKWFIWRLKRKGLL